MVSFHITKKCTTTKQWKHLLGKTVEEVLPHIGAPFASYVFNCEEVYMFDRGTISTIVMRNGIVIRCDNSIESRRTLRVNPYGQVPVILVGDKTISGYLKDLSTAGAAIHHSSKSVFAIGSRVEASFALPIEGISRYFQISCRITENRCLAQGNGMVLLFDLTDTPWKKRLLSRYVQLCSTQTELGIKDPFQRAYSSVPNNPH